MGTVPAGGEPGPVPASAFEVGAGGDPVAPAGAGPVAAPGAETGSATRRARSTDLAPDSESVSHQSITG
jgi:hypothetical protein